MPYVGRDLQRGNYLKLDDIGSSFNGSTTTFNLTSGGNAFFPGSAFSILVSLGGVVQEPESAYQIDRSQIIFATAPTSSSDFFCIALGVALGVGVPGHNTVNNDQLAKPLSYGDYFRWDSANNRVGINTLLPSTALDVVGDATFSGAVSIGGTLTYEDVANIDAVGIITARAGIEDKTLTAGRVVYAGAAGRLVDNSNLTFNPTTLNTPGLSVTGVSTFSGGNLIIKRGSDAGNIIQMTGADTTSEILEAGIVSGHVQFTSSYAAGGNNSAGFIFRTRNGSSGTAERVRIESTGNIIPGTDNSQNVGSGLTNFASIWASTRFRGNDNVKLVLGSSQDLVIRHDGTDNIIGSPQGHDLHIKSGTGDVDNEIIAAFKHSNSFVGIGTTNPISLLHVKEGDSGVTSADTSQDTLFLESNGNAGLTIATPNTNTGYLTFADPDDSNIGQIIYRHGGTNANSMGFFVNTSEKLRINSNGTVHTNMSGTAPTWLGNTMACREKFSIFQGANFGEACFNIDVDNANSFLSHNMYYDGGWKIKKSGSPVRHLEIGTDGWTFYTGDDGSDNTGSALTERFNINADGKVVKQQFNATNTYIGTATTQCGYQAQNLSNTTNTYAALRLTAGTSSPATAQLSSIRTGEGANDFTIQLETGNNAFEALRIKSTGQVLIGTDTVSTANLVVYSDGTTDNKPATIYQNDLTGTGAANGFYVGSNHNEKIGYVWNYEASDITFGTSNLERVGITTTGQVNIGGDYHQTTYKLFVDGSFAATTKSFVIDHPTKEKHKLRYACLEGPENSVYVRGKTSDSVIELPDYWTGLVHEDSITVNVTPIGNHKVWVESINKNSVTIGSDGSEYFYTVFAERKDVDKLEVEVEE